MSPSNNRESYMGMSPGERRKINILQVVVFLVMIFLFVAFVLLG